jgi:hypothetical protein
VERAFAAHSLAVPAVDVAAIAAAVPRLRALVVEMYRMPNWSAEHPSRDHLG